MKNESAVISSLYSKAEIQKQEGREFLAKTFGGSLPAFLAAFASEEKLSEEGAQAIRRMIECYEGAER